MSSVRDEVTQLATTFINTESVSENEANMGALVERCDSFLSCFCVIQSAVAESPSLSPVVIWWPCSSAHHFARWLRERGWDVLRQSIDGGTPGRANLLATRPGMARTGGPRVLMNTHLDTVPPFYEARLSEDGSTLHGRGACDVKGLLAAQLVRASLPIVMHLHDHNPLTLSF